MRSLRGDGTQPMSQDKSELLRSLRIDRDSETDTRAGLGAPMVIAIAAAAGLAGVGLGWIAKPPAKPAAVAAAPASQAPAANPAGVPASGLTASGYVVARLRATIAAEVTGRVVEVRVEEGQTVRKGEVLAVLDSQTARADAAAARTRAQSANSAIDVAEANNAEAQRALERARDLAAKGFFSEANLKTAQARAESAAAELN